VTNRTKKTPAKKTGRKAPAKAPAKETAESTPEEDKRQPVEPLASDAFQMLMELIDNAPFKGKDAIAVLNLKREVVRVAGIEARPA
jgi:hypothetical protein